jgi:hypothetical protein
MTRLVQVTVAADLAEAEEIQTILHTAGIACRVEPAVEHHPTGLEDAPQRVLVAESVLEDAQAAIEELSEPDEFLGDE